jgi:hypothetical protein
LFWLPFVDLQGWQRTKVAIEEKKPRAFTYAALAFGLYLFFIFSSSFFVRPDVAAFIILIIAFCVATSTLDSNAVAIQSLSKKRGFKNAGFWLTVVAVISWPIVREVGIVNLWVYLASARMFISMGIITFVLLYTQWEKDQFPFREKETN